MELFETEVDWRDVGGIAVDDLAHFVDREPDGRERGISGGRLMQLDPVTVLGLRLGNKVQK